MVGCYLASQLAPPSDVLYCHCPYKLALLKPGVSWEHVRCYTTGLLYLSSLSTGNFLTADSQACFELTWEITLNTIVQSTRELKFNFLMNAKIKEKSVRSITSPIHICLHFSIIPVFVGKSHNMKYNFLALHEIDDDTGHTILGRNGTENSCMTWVSTATAVSLLQNVVE